MTCKIDQDCTLFPFNVCITGLCDHKGVFPIYDIEFMGLIILTLLTVLSNVGGIGGGGIIIPIMMSMFGFSMKEAIANSGVLIFFGSITRFFL